MSWSRQNLSEKKQEVFDPNLNPADIPGSPIKHATAILGRPVVTRPRKQAGEKLTIADQAFVDLLEKGIIRYVGKKNN